MVNFMLCAIKKEKNWVMAMNSRHSSQSDNSEGASWKQS